MYNGHVHPNLDQLEPCWITYESLGETVTIPLDLVRTLLRSMGLNLRVQLVELTKWR